MKTTPRQLLEERHIEVASLRHELSAHDAYERDAIRTVALTLDGLRRDHDLTLPVRRQIDGCLRLLTEWARADNHENALHQEIFTEGIVA